MKSVHKRSFSNKNRNSFKQEIAKQKWENIYQYKDTQSAYSYLLEIIRLCLEKSFPCRDATHVWEKNRKTENIYISAINGPSLPPKPLEYRCSAFCCAELPLLVTPVWGKKENRKIFISVIKGQKSMPRMEVCQ